MELSARWIEKPKWEMVEVDELVVVDGREEERERRGRETKSMD